MRRICALAALLCVLLGGFAGCARLFRAETPARLAQMTGVDLSGAQIRAYYDTHGGFLGDGELCAAARLTNAASAEVIAAAWEPLPLPAALREACAAWPGWSEFAGRKDYREAGVEKAPWDVAQGYYYYWDRFSDTHDFTDGTPNNLTLIVYEPETELLYIYELET